MKRVLAALIVVLALGATAYGSWSDFEQITVDATAAGVKLTAAKVSPFTTSVVCKVRTAEISFLTMDPAVKAVTSSVGTLAEPGDQIVLTTVQQMQNFRAIRTTATSAGIDCSYVYSQQP